MIVGKENEAVVAEEVAAQGKETKNDDGIAVADTIDTSVSTVNPTTTGKKHRRNDELDVTIQPVGGKLVRQGKD